MSVHPITNLLEYFCGNLVRIPRLNARKYMNEQDPLFVDVPTRVLGRRTGLTILTDDGNLRNSIVDEKMSPVRSTLPSHTEMNSELMRCYHLANRAAAPSPRRDIHLISPTNMRCNAWMSYRQCHTRTTSPYQHPPMEPTLPSVRKRCIGYIG